MAAKFDISKDQPGKFRFHLKVPNGEIIAPVRATRRRPTPRRALKPIKAHTPGAAVEDKTG